MVMLTSLSGFGGIVLIELAIRMGDHLLGVMLSGLAPLQWVAGCQPLSRQICLQLGYAIGQGLW